MELHGTLQVVLCVNTRVPLCFRQLFASALARLRRAAAGVCHCPEMWLHAGCHQSATSHSWWNSLFKCVALLHGPAAAVQAFRELHAGGSASSGPGSPRVALGGLHTLCLLKTLQRPTRCQALCEQCFSFMLPQEVSIRDKNP